MSFTVNPITGELDFYNTKRAKLKAGTPGAVLFNDISTGRITEDASNLYWDDTNNRLSVGTQANTIPIDGTSFSGKFNVKNDTTFSSIFRAQSATLRPSMTFARARDSAGSPAIVQSADFLGSLTFLGFNGTDYTQAAGIFAYVDGTPGAADMPGGLIFAVTPDGSTTLGTALTIFNNKVGRFASTLEVTSQLNVGATGTPTAQQDIIVGSSSRIGQIIKAAASQSADMTQWQDSSGNSMLEVNSDGTVTFAPTNLTISSPIFFNTTSTLTGAAATPRYFQVSNTFNQTSTPSFALPPLYFNAQSSVNATTNNLTMAQPASFNSQHTMTANGVVWTGADVFGSFTDVPTYSIAAGGSFASVTHTSFRSSLAINSGATIDTRRGLLIGDASGAGTLTTQIGIRIGNLTKGTTNIAIQSLGGESRHVGNFHVGADTTPTAKLQVTGTFAMTKVDVTFASPTSITVTSGSYFKISPCNANFTINASGGGTAGQLMIIQWSTDASGTRTVTYGTNFKPNGTQGAGGASTTATTTWISDGTSWWELSRQNNMA